MNRLQEIEDRFEVPVGVVPQLESEAQGLETLSDLGQYLLSDSREKPRSK
jgi:hypothetical protein